MRLLYSHWPSVQIVSCICRLPSFTEAYTQSTPLTRIRDIAHRVRLIRLLIYTSKHALSGELPALNPLGMLVHLPLGKCCSLNGSFGRVSRKVNSFLDLLVIKLKEEFNLSF